MKAHSICRTPAALAHACVVACVLLGGGTALAQDYSTYAKQYSKLVSQASDIKALDDRMFGDEESLYTGILSFAATDVSLPGIGALSMAVSRKLHVEDEGADSLWAKGAFGDWSLDLPRLYGTFAATGAGLSGWTMDSSPLRCGGSTEPYFSKPPVASGPGRGYFDPDEYWDGNHFSMPGGGTQEMMLIDPANANKPTDGGDYRWVTNNNWYFSCLPATANGYAGDAFLARGPDGSKIWFNYLTKRPASMMVKYLGGPLDGARLAGKKPPVVQTVANGPQAYSLGREVNELLPTRIEDRFGNSLVFTYDPLVNGRLISMQASDGRTITLTYSVNGRVEKVSDGTRTWLYAYLPGTGSTGYSLSTVTLPDGSKWQYNLMALAQFKLHPPSSEVDTCNYMPGLSVGTVSGTVTHPSGAVGTFVVAGVRHGRSYVTKHCIADGIADGPNPIPYHAMYPKVFDTSSIVSKQISGPGLSGTQTWTYSYGPHNGSWSDCAGTCPTTKTVLVRQPEGRYQLLTFGNRFRTDEGRIYSIESGTVIAGSPETLIPLKTEQFTFQTTAMGQLFPANVGLITFPRGDWMAALLNPQKTHVHSQDSVTYTNTANTFDRFANPLSVTRSSMGGAGGNFSRAETTAYYHDTAKWVLGQVASVTDGATGKVMSLTAYNAASALPVSLSRFGLVQQTMSYNADGTLAWVKDGLNHTITLSNWYRGVPRTINYPTSVSESAVVNPIGTLASTTDELGYTHSYGYDQMGRLSGITYPTADTTVWNGTTRSFTPVASDEYGLPAGHWKQVVKTGNGWATTFYDAQWRPVLVLTEDTGSATSKSFVVHRYDTAGREVFVSYPVGSLTTINDTLTGVSTVYDALSRVLQVKQDSELGVLTTTTEYLSGFQTRVTNPRGIQTTTSYQLFDGPGTESPVKIITGVGAPEQQTTTIVRDGFGKPLTVTRSGAGG